MTLPPLFLFCVTLSVLSVSASAAGPRSIQEYCGTRSHPALRPLYQWDCSGLTMGSMAALRTYVASKYVASKLTKTTNIKIYESTKRQAHYSAWVIYPDGKAVRYRALYDGNGYQHYLGVGITVFCSNAVNDCAAFEAVIASGFPPVPIVPSLFPHTQYQYAH